jgi:uncharacterized protein YdeI (YjbR/CyaY-like superfamily)
MQKTFQGVVESLGTGPVRVVIRVPFDPAAAWPERSGARSFLRVKGTIRAAGKASRKSADAAEAFPFHTTLTAKRYGNHLLVVNAKMQKGGKVMVGSLAEVMLEPDTDDTAAAPPPELAKLLKADRSVKKWFDALSYAIRKYIADNITEPKSAEARVRRAEQWTERLMLAMEGEESIPPVLQVAFRRQPQARAGWEAISVNRRRWHLLSIFSCQSPEARANAVERAMTQAMSKAGQAKRKSAESDIEE